MKWQLQQHGSPACIHYVVGPMAAGAVRVVEVALRRQEGIGIMAARADGPAPAHRLERGCGLAQMVARKLGLPGHAMLPHVIGELVAALHRRLQRRRIELANAPRREDRGLDAARGEQLQQPPDTHPPPEFALGQLHRRLVVEPAQQHGIEVDRKVDGHVRAIWPGEVVDQLETAAILRCRGFERGKLGAEAIRHVTAPKNKTRGQAYRQARRRWEHFRTTLTWAPWRECTRVAVSGGGKASGKKQKFRRTGRTAPTGSRRGAATIQALPVRTEGKTPWLT